MELRDCSRSLIHSNCGNMSCPVYRMEEKGLCNRESVTHEIKCTGCKNTYVGETTRSMYTRENEHSKSLSNKEERLALWKHCREKQNSEIQQFQTNVTGVNSNNVILSQISEGIKINNVDEDSLINSKSEKAWTISMSLTCT